MGTGVVEEGETLTGDNVLRYRTSMANTDVTQLVEKTNKVLEKWGYSEVRGNAEEMLSVSASVKARQDLRLRIVFAIVSATSLIGAWITSGGGFNRQYLIAFIGLTLISSIYSFFTYVDMGSRDAASAILNHRASTA